MSSIAHLDTKPDVATNANEIDFESPTFSQVQDDSPQPNFDEELAALVPNWVCMEAS